MFDNNYVPQLRTYIKLIVDAPDNKVIFKQFQVVEVTAILDPEDAGNFKFPNVVVYLSYDGEYKTFNAR